MFARTVILSQNEPRVFVPTRWDILYDNPVAVKKRVDDSKKRYGQRCHLLKLFPCPFALLFLFETLKVNRIMFLAERMNVVNDDEVLGMLVSLFTMIPEGARIEDQLAALLEKHIVEGNDTSLVNFVSSNCCNQSIRALLTAS